MSSAIVLTRASPARSLNAKMFDRHVKGLQRTVVSSPMCDLHKLCAEQILDRRAFVKRETPVVLEAGAHTGWYFKHLIQSKELYGLKQYIQTDICEERLNKNYEEVKGLIPPGVEFVQICCDEEEESPFSIPERSVDMVVSCLSMHWVNDLETAMVNIRRILKKDGFFLGCMLGGNTLYELRGCFTMAQTEVLGGVSPHVSPTIDGAGLSSLLLQAGFNLPSIDLDRHLLLYENPFQLMEHLADMGESACHLNRQPLGRDVLAAACAVYDVMYRTNGLIPATFEVFHTIAWSPSPTQTQPLRRGSGQIPFSSLNSANHREIQSIMNEYAKNPTDEALLEKAEDMFQRLREESTDLMAKKGLDTRGFDLNRTEETRAMNRLGKPAPPFQTDSEQVNPKQR